MLDKYNTVFLVDVKVPMYRTIYTHKYTFEWGAENFESVEIDDVIE